MLEYKKILIVDDDLDDREILTEVINEIDDKIKCVHASNGEEALYKLETLRNLPDCIFLDINMPKIDGKECLRIIKKDDRFKNIPVIIFSTSQQISDIQECKLLGAEDFFTKPGCLKDLYQKLNSFLNKKLIVTEKHV